FEPAAPWDTHRKVRQRPPRVGADVLKDANRYRKTSLEEEEVSSYRDTGQPTVEEIPSRMIALRETEQDSQCIRHDPCHGPTRRGDSHLSLTTDSDLFADPCLAGLRRSRCVR